MMCRYCEQKEMLFGGPYSGDLVEGNYAVRPGDEDVILVLKMPWDWWDRPDDILRPARYRRSPRGWLEFDGYEGEAE